MSPLILIKTSKIKITLQFTKFLNKTLKEQIQLKTQQEILKT
jgi:hypothetical protein